MGLYERDYSRESEWSPEDSYSRDEKPWTITTWLIIANIVVFVIDRVLSGRGGDALAPLFGAHGYTILRPWLWYQFLTYGFLHNLQAVNHILFNMVGLFFFGRTVEQYLRRHEFLRFYLAAIVIGGIVFSLRAALMAFVLNQPLNLQTNVMGASGAVMAVTILFAFFEPHATILFFGVIPLKAWVVAVGYAVMNVAGFISSGGDTAFDVHLAGIAFAALYHRRKWRLNAFDFGNVDIRKWFKRRPKLKLHDPNKTLAAQEAEADRILDKINAQGLDSLTRQERKTLEAHSRRKRNERRGT